MRTVGPALRPEFTTAQQAAYGMPGAWNVYGVYNTPYQYHSHNTPYNYQTARVVDEQVPAQGIRLRLYSRESVRAGRLQTAWDAYIDGGSKISRERQPILLKTLLEYFGRDFSGRVPLVLPEPE